VQYKYRERTGNIQRYACRHNKRDIRCAGNETSTEYAPILINDPSLKSAGSESELPFVIFAAVPFGDGALVLAGRAADQTFPALYYIHNGRIKAADKEGQYFYLNCTTYEGKTIYFGRMYEETGGAAAATRVEAEFANGLKQSCSSGTLKSEESNAGAAGGYILVADGDTWLADIAFYDQSGSLLSGRESVVSGMGLIVTGTGFPEGLELIKSQYYSQLLPPGVYPQYKNVVITAGGAAIETAHFYGDVPPAFLWRNANNQAYSKTIIAGSEYSVKVFPPLDEFIEYDLREDGEAIGEDAGVFWFDTAADDGTDKDYDEYLFQSVAAPETAGLYCVIIKYEECVYTALVRVV
jgi:hypothetical protein